jgi:hypothetical protein
MTREEYIAALIKDGMPEDLAPRAVDAFENLLDASETLIASETLMHELEENVVLGFWLRYGFMQGFVAGSMASVHHK